jgi:hypothetical protein
MRRITALDKLYRSLQPGVLGRHARSPFGCLLTAIPAMCLGAVASGETIGLVATEMHFAGTFTPDAKLECPNGLNVDNRANFREQFKTREEQEAVIKKFASLDMHNRGPNGESDVYSPELIQDPLPFHEAQGQISDGFNLDGTPDGRETESSCRHTKLRSTDGSEAVDNQLYRVLGCTRAGRPGETYDGYFNREIGGLQVNRWVIEITDVDDRVNDDHVNVTIAKARDKLVPDGSGKYVPGLSQRIDERLPEYTFRTTGRITSNVLTTDAIADLRIAGSGVVDIGERRFINARFRLALNSKGASGVLAGYHDKERYYRFFAKTMGQHGIAVGVSGPSIYAALQRNADGMKDAKTGLCTAISAVYNLEFVSAHIVRQPPSEDGFLGVSETKRGAGERPARNSAAAK